MPATKPALKLFKIYYTEVETYSVLVKAENEKQATEMFEKGDVDHSDREWEDTVETLKDCTVEEVTEGDL